MFNFLKRMFGGGSQPVQRSTNSDTSSKYAPLIESAEQVGQYEVAGRQAVLLSNIVSIGMVQYLYILVVYDQGGEPCLFVASEVNQLRDAFGGGSHFLGVFPGDGHRNLGDSDDWADREKFLARALEFSREFLAAK